MTQRYELICLSIILALLVLAAIAGFFLPPDSRTPELIAPSHTSLQVLAQRPPEQRSDFNDARGAFLAS
jgi:hypothetical protein